MTRPPPDLLKMTAPGMVEIGVAETGVVGARAKRVGAGLVEAVYAEEAASSLLREASALVKDACLLLAEAASLLCADDTELAWVVPTLLLADARLLAADDKLVLAEDRLACTEERLLSTDAMLLEAGETVVVVALLALFASSTRLVAKGGFSEWTCSMALRSLLKTPCLNLGASECRIACIESSSMFSISWWKRSQSVIVDSECGGVGEARADVRRRMLSTTCRRNIMTICERKEALRQRRVASRKRWCSECRV